MLALVALTGLAACQSAPPAERFPTLAYGHLPPFQLDVARIELVQAYKSPGQAPNVEHLFPVVPADAVARWANDRLRAVGASGVARFHIRRAAVVEVKLSKSAGVRGALTDDQSERYDGIVDVMLEIVEDDGHQAARVETEATRRRTVPESISLAQRRKVWFALTEALMNDLNASLERQIKTHFPAHLR